MSFSWQQADCFRMMLGHIISMDTMVFNNRDDYRVLIISWVEPVIIRHALLESHPVNWQTVVYSISENLQRNKNSRKPVRNLYSVVGS